MTARQHGEVAVKGQAEQSPERTAFLAAPAGEGETIWFNGALVTIKAPGAWSDDAFSLAELAVPKGRATALHSDPSDETIHVLEGELLFDVNGQEHRAEAGETVAVRRGTPHAFLALAEVTRFLLLSTPGTHDRFFRAAGVAAIDRSFESAPPPDRERTMQAAEEIGVELLGPPPFPDDVVQLRSG